MSAKHIVATLVAISFMFLSSKVHALVVFDESASGDTGSIVDLGVLGVGTNTITGTFGIGVAETGDEFSLTRTPDLLIISLFFEINNYNASGNLEQFFLFPVGTPLIASRIVFMGDGLFSLGTFALENLNIAEEFSLLMTDADRQIDEGGWDYTISIEVVLAPVPEPGTIALIGGGLAGLGLTIWCRRRARNPVD